MWDISIAFFLTLYWVDSQMFHLAHIVHLSAKHIVQAFSEHGLVMDSNISDIPTDDLPVDIDEDSEMSYAPGDTLRKLWAFINQVCVFCVHDSSHCYYGMLGAVGGESMSMQVQHKTQKLRIGKNMTKHGAEDVIGQHWFITGSAFPTGVCFFFQMLCGRNFVPPWTYQICPDTLVLDIWFIWVHVQIESSKSI